jgi:DNA-binding NarL/FixJ family response regulator
MSERVKILLVEDHHIVRRGLVSMLRLEPELEVVGEAENGQQAIDLALKLQPDVILMDLQMPIMGGVEAVKRIRAAQPELRIIILTTFGDDEHIYEAIAAGARGYVLKDAPPDDLIKAIHAAHRGESLLSPSVAARILDRFSWLIAQPPALSTQAESPDLATAAIIPAIDAPKFTSRELEVLRLMGQGARNKEIAAALVIAERTVKIHVGNILGKLNADNRTEAVTLARKIGVLS